LATRTIRTLAVERTAREGGEQLLAIQRAIIRRAPLQQVLDEITEHARAHLGGRTAVLTLRDDEGLDGHVVSVQGGPDPEAVAALRALPPDELPPGLSGRALTAVLRSDRAVVGRLTVLDAPRAELTSTQAQLFEEFAQHAALAIIGAQTLERLQQARLDPLTGLVNRAGFMDALRTAIWRAGTEGLRVSLLFVDLDRFKDINDTLGHAAGDVVLTT